MKQIHNISLSGKPWVIHLSDQLVSASEIQSQSYQLAVSYGNLG